MANSLWAWLRSVREGISAKMELPRCLIPSFISDFGLLACLVVFCQNPSVTLQSCSPNYFTPFCRTDWIRIKCYKNLWRRRFTLSFLITELQVRQLAAEQQQIARDSPAAVLWIICSIVSGAILLQNICKIMMQAPKPGLLFRDLGLSPFHSSPCSFFFSYCYRIPVQTDCCLKSKLSWLMYLSKAKDQDEPGPEIRKWSFLIPCLTEDFAWVGTFFFPCLLLLPKSSTLPSPAQPLCP